MLNNTCPCTSLAFLCRPCLVNTIRKNIVIEGMNLKDDHVNFLSYK